MKSLMISICKGTALVAALSLSTILLSSPVHAQWSSGSTVRTNYTPPTQTGSASCIAGPGNGLGLQTKADTYSPVGQGGKSSVEGASVTCRTTFVWSGGGTAPRLSVTVSGTLSGSFPSGRFSGSAGSSASSPQNFGQSGSASQGGPYSYSNALTSGSSTTGAAALTTADPSNPNAAYVDVSVSAAAILYFTSSSGGGTAKGDVNASVSL